MSISPGRLLEIAGVGDPVSVAETNFEILTGEVFQFLPSYQNGAQTTIIGPPTSGTRVTNELWKDAWLGVWRCIAGGTPGTWRQERPAIRPGEPGAPDTIPVGYLIRDSNDSYRLKIHLGGYVWQHADEVYRYSHLTGLTGGGTNNLDGVTTTSLSAGAVAQFTIGASNYLFRLRTGTDTEVSPFTIRPDDYDGSTNAKVWERIGRFEYPADVSRDITGLTGGTAADLNGIPTINLSVGKLVWFIYSGSLVCYRLRTGTDATASPTVIRPSDFQSTLNPKVWERVLIVQQPGDVMLGSNNLSEVGGSTTSRAAARSAIDVLWADDARGMVSNRAPRGGLYIESAAAFKISGSSGVNVGLFDFSVAFGLQLPDYTPSSAITIFSTHTAGQNFVSVILETSGVFKLRFDAAGVQTDYSLTPDVALVDGDPYSLVIACDRDGSATLYVNGVSDRDRSGSGVSVPIAAHSSLDIGSGNVNGWGAGYQFQGNLYALRVYNRCLSANDALILARLGTIAYADQLGSMTAAYTSDFSAGVDGWNSVGGDPNIVLTGNTDGINGQNDWLKVQRITSAGRCDINKTLSVLPLQHKRIKVRIYNDAASSIAYFRVGYSGLSGATPAAIAVPPGTQVDCDFEYTHSTIAGSNVRIEPANADGSLNTNVTAGSIYYVKTILIYDLGSLLDVDAVNADPSLSLNVKDYSSNANHGTAASSGVTQIRKIPQANVNSLAVGGSTVLKKLLSNSTALDFGSIAAASSADLPITVTGAAVGDSVCLGLPSSPTAGIVFNAFVSAVNTVTVRAFNITGSPIDPASATYRVTVFNF